MGFDHVVANMFFLPAAIFADTGITWGDALHNWLFAFVGNFVGAALFVATAYWYLYGRDAERPGDEPASRGTSGRFARDGAGAEAATAAGNGEHVVLPRT
jgi:hypothetical protein